MARIRHSSAVKPISIPVRADVAPANWDRVQGFNPAVSQPSEKLYEIGRLERMVSEKGILEATLSITQLENGTITSFKQLTGLASEPAEGFSLANFNDSLVDFYLPGKDESDGTIEQTLWLAHMSVNSFALAINADEKIERTFDLSGEFARVLRHNNKCLIFKTDDAPSGVLGAYEIDVDDPAPVESPNHAGEYIMEIVRVRDGVASYLVEDTDFTYSNATKKITILAAETSDHHRIIYTASSYGTAGDPTALNDVDDYYIKADNVIVVIEDGTNPEVVLDKLTSVGFDVTFNRIDEPVVGSNEKLLKDVESTDVNINFEGYVKNSDIEEVLMHQAGQDWGIIDFSLFKEVKVTIEVYKEASKDTFMIAYQATNCEYADSSQDYTANEFASNPVSLTTDNLKITTNPANL